MATTIEAKLLSSALKAALKFASKDDSRPHIASVTLSPGCDNRLVIVGVDGHRLVVVSVPSTDDPWPEEVVLPRKEAERLLSSLPKDGTASLVLEGWEVRAGACGTYRIADEKPVVYRAVIPPLVESAVTKHYGIDPNYMIDAMSVFTLLHGKNASVGCNPTASELDARRFDSDAMYQDMQGIRATVVVMPKRCTVRPDPAPPPPKRAKLFVVPRAKPAKKKPVAKKKKPAKKLSRKKRS